MRAREKLAVVGIVALLALPTALSSAHTETAVAGHSVYSSMDSLDRCLAGIVGIARTRVMWFNEAVLFERNAAEGQNWVYAVQNGSASPVDQVLYPTGQVFPFTDPNGVDWVVTEYNYTATKGPPAEAHPEELPGNPLDGSVETGVHGNPDNASLANFHTWVVRIGPTTDDFSLGSARPYNFVDLVDTCKFDRSRQQGTWGHDNSAGTWSSTNSTDTTQDQHLASDGPHDHDVFSVDLYLGPEPRLQPVAQAGDEYLGEVS